jgi:hypothetical protein
MGACAAGRIMPPPLVISKAASLLTFQSPDGAFYLSQSLITGHAAIQAAIAASTPAMPAMIAHLRIVSYLDGGGFGILFN